MLCTRPCQRLALLCIVLVCLVALPSHAEYTKLYRVYNHHDLNMNGMRVLTNGLEVITAEFSAPVTWQPSVIQNVLYYGTYCTRMKFIGSTIVLPGNPAKVGWSTADNNCRLMNLYWYDTDGSVRYVLDPEQLQGAPGGGEVRYDPIKQEYVWLLVNDTGLPIDLSNVSLQVLDQAPSLAQLSDMVWPQSQVMRTMQSGETLPHPDLVAPRVAAVLGEQIEPLQAAVAAAQAAGYLSDADAQGLLGALGEAETGVQAGGDAYPLDAQQAEADWADAAAAATDFRSLVAEIDAKQPILFQPSSWPHWAAGASSRANDNGVLTGYCKPTGTTHYAYLWDSREPGDDGFVDLHGIAINDLGLSSSWLTTARDINSEGYVVGGAFASYGGDCLGVLWEPDGNGSYTALAVVPPGGYSSIELYGINDLGQVAAWAETTAGVYRTLLYQYNIGTGNVVLVQDLGYDGIGAKDINNVGQVCGLYWTGSVYKPFRWDPPVVTGGPPRLVISPGSYWSHAGGGEISDDGYTIGGDWARAWVWLNDADATPVALSTYPPHSGAAGINTLGDAVGGYAGQAAAWDLGSPGYPQRSLHPAAWGGGSAASDVNELGDVAGWCQPVAGGSAYVYVVGLDVLPYVLPEGMAQEWLHAADMLIAAIEWLPGPGEAAAAELPPPTVPPPPPPPPGDDPTQEYTYTDWSEIQQQTQPTLPPDSYTAFVVPDSDSLPNEALLLKTTLYPPQTQLSTAQTQLPLLEVAELYTAGTAGVQGADTTPPQILNASITPESLWPPNNKMVEMQLDVTVYDENDDGQAQTWTDAAGVIHPLATWFIESVSCDQAEDGEHEPDWRTDAERPHFLELRAERDDEDMDGRRYTVVIRAVDAGGSLSEASELEVVVPHDPVRGNLTIAALAAVPGDQAVEVVFTLSADAAVEAEVFNIAGRRVATVVTDRDCEAGVSRLIWNCQSDRGLAVPSGTYLLRLTARTANGQQSSRLCTVPLRR